MVKWELMYASVYSKVLLEPKRSLTSVKFVTKLTVGGLISLVSVQSAAQTDKEANQTCNVIV